MSKESITAYLPAELRQDVAKAAEEKGQTLSTFVERALRVALERQER